MAQVSRDHCLMKPALSTIGQMRLKPDSRALGRGALGDAIDGRSREGKFIRRIEAELLDQLGDNELARKLRRAHAEGQIEDADAEAISAAHSRPGRKPAHTDPLLAGQR